MTDDDRHEFKRMLAEAMTPVQNELRGLRTDVQRLARTIDTIAEKLLTTGEVQELKRHADDIVFEGSAEEAIRFLEGEQADETIRTLRAEGLLCGSSD